MNIAAAMTALEVDGLDRSAAHALLAVCCRANRHTGQAWVSIGRIAADMRVSYHTARHALDRLVDTGYLSVDKSCGKRSGWQLTSSVFKPLPSKPLTRTSSATRDVRRSEGEVLRSGGAHAAGENPQPLTDRQRYALDRANIADCPYCDEFGWLWRGDVIHGRCSHHPVFTDLTVDDILNPEPA